MSPIVVEHKVDADGVLRLEIPDAAGRNVRVTVEDIVAPVPGNRADPEGGIIEGAGGWLGEFERPVDPPLTDPEWMNDPDYAGFVKISDYPAGESSGVADDPPEVRRNQPDRSDRPS
jgi:hypothetical protein